MDEGVTAATNQTSAVITVEQDDEDQGQMDQEHSQTEQEQEGPTEQENESLPEQRQSTGLRPKSKQSKQSKHRK
jgi:hypothetical protein